MSALSWWFSIPCKQVHFQNPSNYHRSHYQTISRTPWSLPTQISTHLLSPLCLPSSCPPCRPGIVILFHVCVWELACLAHHQLHRERLTMDPHPCHLCYAGKLVNGGCSKTKSLWVFSELDKVTKTDSHLETTDSHDSQLGCLKHIPWPWVSWDIRRESENITTPSEPPFFYWVHLAEFWQVQSSLHISPLKNWTKCSVIPIFPFCFSSKEHVLRSPAMSRSKYILNLWPLYYISILSVCLF